MNTGKTFTVYLQARYFCSHSYPSIKTNNFVPTLLRPTALSFFVRELEIQTEMVG